MTAEPVTVFACVAILFVLAMLWWTLCSSRTLQQRNAMRTALFRGSYSPEAVSDFLNVSFERHHLALTFFRDPIKLYGPRLRSLLEANHDR